MTWRAPRAITPSPTPGPFYPAGEAERLKTERSWYLFEDAGRGWRRVVPSPRPLAIMEQDVISYLLRGGFIVMAAGAAGCR